VAVDFKEVDKEGLEILEVISKADKFNYWMYETIVPYCGGTVLEIGSGTGNISQFFIEENKNIFLSDIRENYRAILKEKFKLESTNVLNIDIAEVDFEKKYAALAGTFDSVFCLNVVEHIENDDLAIKNMTTLLKSGGTLTVLVPAYQVLFNGFDVTLEHFRRYNKKSLVRLLSKHGKVQNAFYFNAVGILGWWVSGQLFKNKTIPEGEMKLYNFFVPLIRIIDKILFRKVGLSVVGVLKKGK
jgi:2-polyprenyl-3-methyl-5-hydroxy-6-metoxy-1,4-benzoquinol methylase